MTEKVVLVVTVTALCMISPGPDMLLVMRSTLVRDRYAGALTALGVLTGNLIHISYCVVGIAVLVSKSAPLYDALRVGGAIYLVYLGVQDLKHATRADDESLDVAHSHRPYRQGLVNNLLNPKGSLFYLGVFTQVITPGMSLSETALLVAAMISVSALFWIIFVYTLHLPVMRAGLDRWKVSINRVFGVVLILVGVRVAMLR